MSGYYSLQYGVRLCSPIGFGMLGAEYHLTGLNNQNLYSSQSFQMILPSPVYP